MLPEDRLDTLLTLRVDARRGRTERPSANGSGVAGIFSHCWTPRIASPSWEMRSHHRPSSLTWRRCSLRAPHTCGSAMESHRSLSRVTQHRFHCSKRHHSWETTILRYPALSGAPYRMTPRYQTPHQ